MPVGVFGVNCILLWETPDQTVVIDPGADPEQIEQVLRSRHLTVDHYLLTHGHIDHIAALDALVTAHPAPVTLHALDAEWAFSERNRIPPYMTVPPRPPSLETTITDGTVLNVGGLTWRVLATPGHTPGGVCYLLEAAGILISGDTLFAGSIGRTDLPGGDMPTLLHSLERLATLDPALRVIPGHGPATDIGTECRTNPFLNRSRELSS